MIPEKPAHPGAFIRQNVIPAGMSVKEAAKRLGVGRPALSNFLNGRSALSPQMAIRLEKTFGANRQDLLDLQLRFDGYESRSEGKSVSVRAYVPSFLTIKAKQIEEWSRGIEARTQLAVLLRKLVHSTGTDLRQADFPGYDNAERKGPDGLVEAGSATPWMPEGKSYWEFGTDKRPEAKAERDYAARIASVPPKDRAGSTFIFVTPRNWHGKTEWEKRKNATGDWNAVKVLDASNLEQWLEQSVPAQIWIAEKLAVPFEGCETLERSWDRWATASDPNLTSEIFAPSIATHRSRFKRWISEPSEKPLTVAADSTDEALAFLACLFMDAEFSPQSKDLAAVFTQPETLKRLIQSSVPFIPIVHSADVERELAAAYRRLHCIVVRPRNAVDTEADITLDLLDYETFRNALATMGIEDDRVEQLARESGRSPTILRRRLSPINAIRTPVWANDDATAKALVSMTFIGAWSAESGADQEIASFLADRPYEAIEEDIARLVPLNDSPIWSAGRYRGVASKIDALFAVARAVTHSSLDRFLTGAAYVLSESAPALDLPEKDRWAAALYGKKRDHSSALREGICETLVMLSVHGNNLLQGRLGIDVEGRVVALIRQLMTPLSLEKLLSHDGELPRYAEAAPNEFLRLIEEDLNCDQPVVLGLLKPVDSGAFGARPWRTGLLWALECLAWKPQNLPRVSAILAQLSGPRIDDNWGNRPDASLRAIFRSWMPQTAASVEQRIMALKALAKGFPDVGWQICIDEFRPASRIGHSSYRPRWRSDASGAGQVVTSKEAYNFARAALDLVIAWPQHDEKTLSDLVESLPCMPDEDQTEVWNLIDTWSDKAGEGPRATLRERIRRFALTRRSRHRKLNNVTRDRAREAYVRLEPRNPVIRHRWLFATHWVEEPADEIGTEDFSFSKREEMIDTLRREAMKEVWDKRGFEGVKALLDEGEGQVVGRYAASCVRDIKPSGDFVRGCLSLAGALQEKADSCLHGFLHAMEDGLRDELLKAVARVLPPDHLTRLFVSAPFRGTTWRLLDRYGNEARKSYWRNVFPSWGRHTSTDLTELVDSLLEVKRPRAAFHAIHMDLDDMETSRLKRLLREVATVDAEPADHYKLDRYYISKALDALDGRPRVTLDEMAQLEFLFIGALDDSEHGIPNLEKQIAESPAVFVQAVALCYKRDDDGADPSEWTIANPEQRAAVAMAAHRLLDQIQRLPATDDDGRIDVTRLSAWLAEARRLFREHARTDVGDHCLGQLLARAPAGEQGVWPCEAICEAMEGIASAEIGKGFYIGVHNSRGVHWRGEGGTQERELAAKYRSWAEQLQFNYPYVGGVLESIASSYDREAGWQDSRAKVRKRLSL